jgi:uncharacterized membrane protein
MSLINDIEKLVGAEIITEETANQIRAYYNSKEANSSNRLLVIFGVLGAFLIGMGIILIIAHNWDQLPRFVKTIFAFVPLLIGQGLCGYTLWKKKESQTWRESSSIFLILSIGAAIALVSQVYHLEGDMQGFLLIWMILSLPVVYLMMSSVSSLLYITATFFFTIASFDNYASIENPLVNWLLIGLIIPYYWYILKNRNTSNATSFHHWFIPITIIIASIYSTKSAEYGIAPILLALFGSFYMIGHIQHINSMRLRANGYLIIGALGTICLLLGFTFSGYWDWIAEKDNNWIPDTIYSQIIAAIIMCTAIVLFAKHILANTFNELTPIMPIFIIFIVLIFISGFSPGASQLLTNFIILAIAVLTIKSGVDQDHLGILNYGLIIITALLICRFFDTDLNFILRGILFILVGIAFFITNNILIKKRSKAQLNNTSDS